MREGGFDPAFYRVCLRSKVIDIGLGAGPTVSGIVRYKAVKAGLCVLVDSLEDGLESFRWRAGHVNQRVAAAGFVDNLIQPTLVEGDDQLGVKFLNELVEIARQS